MEPRNDPFSEMDRLFDQMRRNMYAAWNAPIGSWSEGETPAFEDDDRRMTAYDHDAMERSRTDVNLRFERTDDAIVAVADLPGFERSEIDLTFDDGMLTIEAVHEVSEDDHYGTRRVFERARIADDVVAEEATASYSNGVLELHLPLAEHDDDATSIDIE